MAIGIERKLLKVIKMKYPKPLHHMLHDPLMIPTLAMEKQAQSEKKLSELLANLPNWGVGRIVTSCFWSRSTPTFWRITKVFVDHQTDNFNYGLAWGVFTEKGRCRYYEEEVFNANEYMWRLVPRYDEDYFVNYKSESQNVQEVPLYLPLPPLMSCMYKERKSKEQAKTVFDEPMVRLLFERNPHQTYRQKLDNNALV